MYLSLDEQLRADNVGLPPLRIAILLPGLGRVRRGAETAFLALAEQFAKNPAISVTLFGSGSEVPPGVQIVNVGCIPRERFEGWPKVPVLRDECCYEELSFVLRLTHGNAFRARRFDLALHCSFPFINWLLTRAGRRTGMKSVFVTENGDWMCRAASREFRTFRCDGLVCTNPEYYDRHKDRYPSVLIPNGVDPDRYRPATGATKGDFGPKLGPGVRVVLMVSALIPSKRVAEGVRAVARLPDTYLMVAGDGPERHAVAAVAAKEMPGRHLLLGAVRREEMPALYRRADAFLHMSQDEPSCISYLEAAATGLPMVIHDAPVPRWTLGAAARYVNTSDLDAVAAAVRAALGPDGPAMGEAARARVMAGWTWAALARQYVQFFGSLVPQFKPQDA
jgi:glycosyltransferase involved in cell wall biosynthesis